MLIFYFFYKIKKKIYKVFLNKVSYYLEYI